LVDTTQMAVGTIGFQRITKSGISNLIKRNLHITAFIISENDTVTNQLELLNTANINYKRRFFEKKQYALTWLAEKQFYYIKE